MITDKIVKPSSGFLMFFLVLLSAGAIGYAMSTIHPAFSLLYAAWFFLLIGFFIVNPNDAKVLVLFGKYAGTVT